MTDHQHYLELEEKLADAATVLLLAPSFSEHENCICADLLVPEETGEQNALWVSYTKSPDRQINRFRSHSGSSPDNIGIISVDDAARSAAAVSSDGGGVEPLTETITSPNDLTGLGIHITEYLKRWQGTGGRTVVCFDSLTAMLQYVDLDTAYQFLHVLTGRFATVGGFAHFHMDPTAHDDRTVQILLSLFDAVVELDEDGPTVRSR